MNESIHIPVTTKGTANAIWRLCGAADALTALRDAETNYGKLPGLGMAIATVEGMVADLRAQIAGSVIREAAKAGHDITRNNVFTTIQGSDLAIEIRPFDLTDLAADA